MVNGANSSKYVVKNITSVQKKTQFYFVQSLAVYSLMFFDSAHVKYWSFTSESSQQRCSVKKVLPQACNLLKQRHRCFPVSFTNFLKTPFLKERPWVIAFIHLKLLGSKYDLFGKLWGFRGNLRLIFAQKKDNFHRWHYP